MKKFRLLLLFFCFCHIGSIQAEDEIVWCLVTETDVCVPMTELSCLVAADDDSTFSIVLNSGDHIAGVKRASFDKRIPTGIDKVDARPIRVCNSLIIPGVPADARVNIYTLRGQLVQQSRAGEIDVSPLKNDIYVLKVADKTFKFQKR